jgi:ribonucleoside-diphosphate reductase alpha chain
MIKEGIPYVLRDTKAIFSFPVKSPEGSICTRDMGAIEQLELWKIYREHWCEGNPSQTIFYTDDSFLDVQAWVYKNWDIIGGLSFFPLDDFVYNKETQPYLEITEEEYRGYLEEFPTEINWVDFMEEEDMTTGSQEFACSGGKCDL